MALSFYFRLWWKFKTEIPSLNCPMSDFSSCSRLLLSNIFVFPFLLFELFSFVIDGALTVRILLIGEDSMIVTPWFFGPWWQSYHTSLDKFLSTWYSNQKVHNLWFIMISFKIKIWTLNYRLKHYRYINIFVLWQIDHKCTCFTRSFKFVDLILSINSKHTIWSTSFWKQIITFISFRVLSINIID